MEEIPASGATTQIVWDPLGWRRATMSVQAFTRGFIQLPGQSLAFYNGSGFNSIRHADWLGSTRLATAPDGSFMGSIAVAPYGEQYALGGSPGMNFTGQRVLLSGDMWDFPARQLHAIEGRWLTPDRAGLAAVDITDPQTWNRYAYVRDTPTGLVDPSGLATVSSCPYGIDPSTGQCRVPPSIQQQLCDAFDLCEPSPVGSPGPGPSGTPPGGGGGGSGLRLPNETFTQCMQRAANLYSLAGAAEAGVNVLTGTYSSFSSNPVVQAVAGNSINTFLFGSTAEAGLSMAAQGPTVVTAAMGNATTFARRTADLMSINIAGKGGLPFALSQASSGLKAVASTTADALSFGMSLTTRLGVDVAFTGAEIIGCLSPQ